MFDCLDHYIFVAFLVNISFVYELGVDFMLL